MNLENIFGKPALKKSSPEEERILNAKYIAKKIQDGTATEKEKEEWSKAREEDHEDTNSTYRR